MANDSTLLPVRREATARDSGKVRSMTGSIGEGIGIGLAPPLPIATTARLRFHDARVNVGLSRDDISLCAA